MGNALISFRNPPLVIETPAPLIFNLAAQPNEADVVGNNAYFSNLSVVGNPAGTVNNSLTTNYITPTATGPNDPFYGDYHLGVYGIADGTSAHAIVFDIYESILNPSAPVQFGVGQFTKLSLCSSPPNGPFIIRTNHSGVGGQARGLLIVPELTLQLGTGNVARWDIQTSTGNLVPSSGQTVNIGDPSNGPVSDIYAYGFHTIGWDWVEHGSFQWNNSANAPILIMRQANPVPSNPGAGLGSLFFMQGTNNNTMALAARCGPTSAVVKLFDNIPAV